MITKTLFLSKNQFKKIDTHTQSTFVEALKNKTQKFVFRYQMTNFTSKYLKKYKNN